MVREKRRMGRMMGEGLLGGKLAYKGTGGGGEERARASTGEAGTGIILWGRPTKHGPRQVNKNSNDSKMGSISNDRIKYILRVVYEEGIYRSVLIRLLFASGFSFSLCLRSRLKRP